jgi:phosphatidylserine/phosphatidylglycerophosphate/cardiolipin synthase-like enzyme
MESGILAEGRNCWRLPVADRLAVMVDAADYYAAVGEALARARESVMIVGWDVNADVELWRDGEPRDRPGRLGELLRHRLDQRPELVARVLSWDLSFVFAFERRLLPLLTTPWNGHPRLDARFDSRHPAAASHHQKLVVIDDALAFVGGIDLSADRWDTSDHLPDDPRRTKPNGAAYGPFHDLQAAVTGEAARALGEVASDRWERATDQRLDGPAERRPLWPAGLEVDLTDVPVGVARTLPDLDGGDGAREIEQLFYDAFAAARRWIYIENQYLSSRRLAEALAERLAADDGPEVVVVMPRDADGWLESSTMDLCRARQLDRLRAADRHCRLRVLYPVLGDPDRTSVYVHSKLMIVDDELVRLGSANFSNRSLGFDSELDVAVEAAGDPRVRELAADLRARLLGEHLGVPPAEIRERLDAGGSLVAVVDALAERPGRTLLPIDGSLPSWLLAAAPRSELLDPCEPLIPDVLRARLAPLLHAAGAGRQLERGVVDWVRRALWLLAGAGLVALLVRGFRRR